MCPYKGLVCRYIFGLRGKMVTVLLCVLLAVAFAAGQEQDGTIFETNVADMSDRELIEMLVKSVSHLETERVKQQGRIEFLEDTVLKQHKVIADLQKVLENRERAKDTTLFKAGASEESDQGHVKQNRLVRAKENVRRVERNAARRAPATPVAFSAIDSSNQLHLGTRQNLVFDLANVNTNNVYNPHHGVFTVPVSGVYVITSTVLAFNNREVECQITVNGVAKAHIYARGTDGRHDQGSHTILLHLKQGNDVTVQNQLADDAVYGEAYTSFSGFLLYEEESETIVG